MTDRGSGSREPRLLDEAQTAAEQGDWSSAAEFATEILRRDPTNEAARDLVGRSEAAPGEFRRITIMFCDLVGSTSMSGRLEVDVYRRLLQRYHRECTSIIAEFGGQVNRRAGDGVLALFGYPESHEDDTYQAVRAGLALRDRFAATRDEISGLFGEDLAIRVGIHIGPVHLDLVDREVYGLAPNLAARLQDLAAPGSVVVSDEVVELVGGRFSIREEPARSVKGLDTPLQFHTVLDELPRSISKGRPWSTPFVGRVAERDAAIEALAGQVPGVVGVVVRGEPGAGKSRLVAEAMSATSDEERVVLRTVGNEYERSNEFGAAASLLGLDPARTSSQSPGARLVQLDNDLGMLDLEPDAFVPLLAPVLGIRSEAGYDPPAADVTLIHDRIHTALRQWLEAIAARSPLVVEVDDVQWIDASTCELLSSLVADPLDGVRLVATERADSHRLGGERLLTIDLTALDEHESRLLAGHIDHDLDPVHLGVVLNRAQGNPLFLEELTRFAAEDVAVEQEIIDTVSKDSRVPPTLYEPLLARLYAEGTDISLAQAAATIGRSFDVGLLADVSHRPAEAVDRAVESLVLAGLIEPEARPDSTTYWFRHVLIRDIAYDLMPEDQRVDVHGRVGLALRRSRTSGGSAPWSTIATHFHAAGRIDDAVGAYESAADDDRERGALEQGANHLGLAIDLLAGLADSTPVRLREADLRLKRGFLHVSSSGNADPRAVVDYARCLEITRSEESGHEFLATLVALWGYHCARGDLQRADELLADIRATGFIDDNVLMAEHATAQGMVRWFQGRFDEAESDLAFGLAVAPEGIDGDIPLSPWQFPNDPITFLAVQQALTMWQRGRVPDFQNFIRQARSRAAKLPFPHGPFNEAHTLMYQVIALAEMGLLERARASATRVLDIGDLHGFTYWTIVGGLVSSVVDIRRNLTSASPDRAALDEHAGSMGLSVMMQKFADARLLVPYSLTVQAEAVAGAGRPEEASVLLAEALVVAEETQSEFYSAETIRRRAHVRAALGEDPLEDLHGAAALARAQGSVPFEIRALADLEDHGVDVPRLAELLDHPTAAASAGLPGRRPRVHHAAR